MKNVLLIALSLLVTGSAFGYQTLVGSDPSSTAVKEFKQAQKSETATVSDTIVGNELLSYDAANTPSNAYVVTRVGAGQTAISGSALIVGAATKAVASGDTGYFLVQTRGYATVKYDATGNGNAIAIGERLCANSVGAAVKCLHAASHSKVIALESKANGLSGTNLKVLITSD